MITLTGSSVPYHVNLARIGTTERLSFTGVTVNNIRPALVLDGNLMVYGLWKLDIYNVDLFGSFRTNCSLGTFTFNLDNVSVNASKQGFVIRKCNHLIINVTQSTFTSSLLEFASFLTTDALFVDSTFIKLASSNDTESYNAGLLARMPKREGKHKIQISGCTFVGVRQNFSINTPSAAVGIITTKEDTELQLLVENSNFTANARAIDLSLKGISEVEIRANVFRGNSGDGSGGAIRVTATLQKGVGSLSTVKRAAINIVNCTFDHNTASTSSRYNEKDVYYQTRSPGSGGALFVHLKVCII